MSRTPAGLWQMSLFGFEWEGEHKGAEFRFRGFEHDLASSFRFRMFLPLNLFLCEPKQLGEGKAHKYSNLKSVQNLTSCF